MTFKDQTFNSFKKKKKKGKILSNLTGPFKQRKRHRAGLSNGQSKNILLRTHIGEGECNGHGVRHQHQLTAVGFT